MNNEFIYGIHAVKAVLEKEPERLIEVFVLKGREDERLLTIINQLKQLGISLQQMNRKTLDILFPDNFEKHCDRTSETLAEDRFMGRCLNRTGITLNRTVDETGAQMMHFRALQVILEYTRDMNYPQRYLHPIFDKWTERYGWKQGLDLVSNRSISFHHVSGGDNMRRHHAMLYNSCPKGTVMGDKLSAYLSTS